MISSIVQTLSIIVFLTIQHTTSEYVTVASSSGTYNGKLQYTSDGKVVSTFLGIPYAQPPVGTRRFRPPEAYPAFNNSRIPYSATEFKPSCPQNAALHISFVGEWLYENYVKDLEFDEDCLYLNVYVPGDLGKKSKIDKLPVMVWFYGGGFQFGTSSFKLYEGNQLALDGDVIVVTMNFRAGPLGFLTTGDENALGNYGLLDQNLALRWVQNNIEGFGGDSSNVMIFGESSGATSVGHHLVIPASQGLFQKAAAQSGNHGNYYFSVYPMEEAAPVAFELAEIFACPTGDVPNMLDCLREVPVDELINAPGLRFAPVIDGEFIPDDPLYLFKTGQFTKVPYIIGSTSEDGTIGLPDMTIYERGVSSFEVPIFIQITVLVTGYVNNLDQLYQAIFDEYFPHDLSDPFVNLRSTLDMLRDQLFLSTHLRMLKDMTNWGGQCYSFYHKARPDFRPSYEDIELGAAHGDELFFMFGALGENGFLVGNSTENEKALTTGMLRAWTSFAKNGVPYFIDVDGNENSWPVYDSEGSQYVEFNYGMSDESIKTDLHPRVDVFWNEIIPEIGQA